jgi:hypothetical protein
MDLLTQIAPGVFICGLMVLLSYCFYLLIPLFTEVGPAEPAELVNFSHDRYWPLLSSGWDLLKPAFLAGFLLALSLWLGAKVDVNEFSLHNAYRNRLVRCYLGATHLDRKGQAFTGFDENDDFPLHSLRGLGAPFSIINTTLNAVRGKDLGLQTRKAYSFIFTPLFSGFAHTVRTPAKQRDNTRGFYRLTETCSKDEKPYPGVRLGSAMAISGAAASPNMGFYTSPAVAFMLTLFSVRLGWWLGNPMDEKSWESGRVRSSWRSLMHELTGATTEDAKEVYLSDGGHFDNLGVYELVRRRCRQGGLRL